MTRRAALVCGSIFATLSCFSRDLGTGPGPGDPLPTSGQRPTAIAFFGNSPEVSTPGAINVNDTALVSFTVFLTGCVSEVKNETTVAGLDADIRSFQLEYLPTGPDVCTDAFRVETSRVPLIFTQPGQSRVRLFGRQFPGDAPVMVERIVNVVP